MYREELARIEAQEGICDDDFYHYDTPLTVNHEVEALFEAGFFKAKVKGQWGHTFTLRVEK